MPIPLRSKLDEFLLAYTCEWLIINEYSFALNLLLNLLVEHNNFDHQRVLQTSNTISS